MWAELKLFHTLVYQTIYHFIYIAKLLFTFICIMDWFFCQLFRQSHKLLFSHFSKVGSQLSLWLLLILNHVFVTVAVAVYVSDLIWTGFDLARFVSFVIAQYSTHVMCIWDKCTRCNHCASFFLAWNLKQMHES